MKGTQMRLRGSSIILMTGKRIQTWYVIQTIINRRWIPCGDDSKMFKYKTERARDKALAALARAYNARIE